VRADSRAEDEMPASSRKRAHVALSLLRRVADHVDDDVEFLVGEALFESGKISAITGDLPHLTAAVARDRVLPLPAVEHGHVPDAAGVQVFDNPRADQTRPADEKHAHGGSS